ncbi:mechanosensitive ion channel [bacterium SCSIO 12741]|nr:mechanosensitive ion channel [bacterium SCSIO 12741]
MMDRFQHILDYTLFKTSSLDITIGSLLTVLIIALVSRLLAFVTSRVIHRAMDRHDHIDEGKSYAMARLAVYFIYVISIVVALQSLGIDLTILVASSAALFVGIGLGIQNIFNDIVSGLFLLFERNVEVGDIVRFDSTIGRVMQINMRTSILLTRDDIRIIVPNSRLISNSIVNLSKENRNTRYEIEVSVAYGSDTKKVSQLLLESAQGHSQVTKTPAPFVKFSDFGDSGLHFKLIYWTTELWQAEVVKSDIRFKIDEVFRQANITIPFPQRDIHVVSGSIPGPGQSSTSS